MFSIESETRTSSDNYNENGKINKNNKKDKGLRFHYDTSEYDSYAKCGMASPLSYERMDKFEHKFLGNVDISKGKIQVQITTMSRQKAIDPYSKKKERKEYLTFTSNWIGLNYWKEEIRVNSHIEGKALIQQTKIVNKINRETGKPEEYKKPDIPITVFSIPFTKANVDKYL